MNNKSKKVIEKKYFFKFYKNVFLLTIGLILLNSCDEFIDKEPEDLIATGSFYSTPNELAFAVNGVYSLQRDIYGDHLWYLMQESRSDNVGMVPSNADGALNIFQEESSNNILSLFWTRLYILINNANTIIEKANDITSNNSQEELLIARVVGEAKFLRALSYFHLTTTWGGVPLRTLPTSDFDNAAIPKSSQADVFEFIISDLKAAAESLPNNYSGDIFNEVGRATKFAAQALLGKVYLQSGNSQAASDALANIIGQYELLTNFKDIYAAGNDNHAESIFEVGFNPSSLTVMVFNNFFLSTEIAAELGVASGGYGQVPIYFPTEDLMGIYENNDLRAEASFSEFDGVAYISKFIDLSATAEGSDINWIILRYADVLLMKAEADGESTASYELINQVRRRGFGQDPMTPDATIDIDASTPGTFFEKLQLERRREFAFEEQRWIDLLRFPESETISIINNYLATEYADYDNYDLVTPVDSHNLVYPIPALEVTISNKVVTQNPGYE